MILNFWPFNRETKKKILKDTNTILRGINDNLKREIKELKRTIFELKEDCTMLQGRAQILEAELKEAKQKTTQRARDPKTGRYISA